ncbi:MAG: hypothetical protein ACREOV_08600, partial [Candidatus Dormibacteraceae bacterium]
MVVTNLQQMYFAFAVIPGGLSIGQEFTWRTWKTLFTIQPPRTEVVGVKVCALTVVVAIWTAGLLAAAAASSEIAAHAEGLPSGWPVPGAVAAAFGATFLILLVWATLAAMLTTLTRRAATGLRAGTRLRDGRGLRTGIASLPGLPGAAAANLSGTFAPDVAAELGVGAHATVLLSAYAAAFVAVTVA